MNIKINLFCLLFPFSLVFFVSCSDKVQNAEKKGEMQSLPVTEIMVKDTVLHHSYVADIQAVQNVELRARVQGFLERIYVDEGQEVKKGQLLFKINDEEYKAELAKAKANLKSAIAEAKASELEVDRLKVLVEKNVISNTELEVAQAKLDAMKARIEEARSAESNAAMRLSYTSIRAPFDGILDRIPLKTGSLIDHGTLLTTASDVSSVYVYFNVSESEYLEYVKSKSNDPTAQNDVVSLTLADGSGYPYQGSIETMEGEFKASTGSIAFRAHFPNPEKILKHGATGRVSLSNIINDALMVPQKAVFEIQDKNFVFVVDTNNQVRMRSFVPKLRFSHYYIVESGLQAGDKIVYEGIQNITEGTQIMPQPVKMDSLIAQNP
ncbi:membrane fusion protein (multidrug efflux system) [Catalinimonas alkaloidigena]|uniref:efflux RND transporter periplasmic adaptor subunit n=1 Tax=Catalinimonas alkaloidigena TaxID=1075417 RepID=UPI0024072907|nr:efflux RND transporter periplasmic adaptor subunit [Catalinimonas alkaloidigena]MDF9794910.1 membrane fusion protein (multidrug efflux system) [Catalinimonas alkaloidigena]